MNESVNTANTDTTTFTEEDLAKIKLKPVKSNTSENFSRVIYVFIIQLSSFTSNFLDEIKQGVQLKKIDYTNNTNTQRPAGKINQTETNILQYSLTEAIKQRRMELTKHDVNDSEESDSDWSD